MLYSNLDKKDGIHIIEDSNQVSLFLLVNIDEYNFDDKELIYLKNKEKDLDYNFIENGNVIAKNILKFYDFDQFKDINDFTHRKILKREFSSILDKFLINTHIKDELRNEYQMNEFYKEYNKEYYFFEVIPEELIGEEDDKLYSLTKGLNHEYKFFNNFDKKCC